MARKRPKPTTEAEAKHRFAEFPYLVEDTDGETYDDEAARFEQFIREVRRKAFEEGARSSKKNPYEEDTR